MTSVLAAVAIVYGVAAALSVLLQARQMLSRGGSCDVSARFLAAYVGGYAIWLLYGLSPPERPDHRGRRVGPRLRCDHTRRCAEPPR